MALSSQHAPLPVLALAPDAVRGLDGREAVAALWTGACLSAFFPAFSLSPHPPFYPPTAPPSALHPASFLCPIFAPLPRIQSIR